MTSKQAAISRRAIQRKRQAIQHAHRADTFGKREVQYTRTTLIGVLGRFGIQCTEQETKSVLVEKLKAYEQSQLADDERVSFDTSEAFVKDFIPGPSYPLIICTTCETELRSYEFPQHMISNNCQHPVEICNNCLEIYIASYVAGYVAAVENYGDTRVLTCPLCEQELDAGHIREFGRSEDSERFDNAAAELKLRNNPHYRQCLHSNCGSGQICFGNRRKMACKACQGSTCLFHGTIWHEGQTCKQYDTNISKKLEENRLEQLRKNQDALSIRLINKITRPCPGCEVPIYKKGGCDDMICRNCGTRFSWHAARRPAAAPTTSEQVVANSNI